MKKKLNRFLRKRYNIKIINYKKNIDYLNLRVGYYERLFESKIANSTDEDKKLELSNKKSDKLKKIDTNNLKQIDKYNKKITKYDKKIKEIDEINLSSTNSFSNLEIFEDDSIHLEIKNLSMHFGGLKAVDDLSFTVKKGEIFGIIGPNGAGKTTLFNCITQFYEPLSGDIYFSTKFNEKVSLNSYETHNIIDLGLARTFQNIELIWELNVLDNLLVGAHSKYTSTVITHLFRLPKLKIEEEIIKNKAYEILEKLDIKEYAFSYPLGLPYGILKKIELARSLMTDPNLIILDEPAAGLNDIETIELAEIIKEIKTKFNVTIMLVEHDMGLVMSICDTICAISFGKLLAIGSPKEVQNDEAVKKAYLGG